LRRDRVVFRRLVDNRAGDENLRRAPIGGQAGEVLQTLANRRGPIGDALTAAARGVADGHFDRAAATRDFVAELRRQAASGTLDGLAHGGGASDLAAAGPGRAVPANAAAGEDRLADTGGERGARRVSPAGEARVDAQVKFCVEASAQVLRGRISIP
jgi:hypothetical protein